MRSFDELRRMVLALFDVLATIVAASASAAPEAARRRADARDRLEHGLLTVAVCGEFKRGKSTLLSALLDEPGLFPADTMPATNAVTIIRWAAAERVTVTLELPDGTPQTIEIGRDQIADYVTEAGNPGNARRVALVEIETPNPKLASGLVFVDTPGVGSILTEHTAVTLAFLPSADALLFVTDVEKPLLDSELTFLRRAIDAAKLTDDVGSLVCAMAKIDQGTDYEKLLAQNRAKLAALLGLPAELVVLIPVSSWEKLDYLADDDPRSLANSNFGELEAALWDALGRRRTRVLLGGALRAIGDEALAHLEPIEADQRARDDATGRTLTDLQQKAQARQNYLARLDADSKAWAADLDAELKTAAGRVQALGQQEIERNWSRFRSSYVYDSALLDDLAKMADQLGGDLAASLGALLKLVRREVAQAVERFSIAKGFTLDPPDITQLPDLVPPGMPDDLSGVSQDSRGAAFTILRGTSAGLGVGGFAGGAAGGVIGAVLGSVLLPGLGTVAGATLGAQIGGGVCAAVGAFFGFRSGRKNVETQQANSRRSQVLGLFNPLKPGQEKHVRALLDAAFAEIRPAANAELKSRLRQEKQKTANVLRRLAAAQQAAAAGQAADRARFAAERKPFDDLLADVAALDQEVSDMGSRVGESA
jgi:hypothetical protein